MINFIRRFLRFIVAIIFIWTIPFFLLIAFLTKDRWTNYSDNYSWLLWRD